MTAQPGDPVREIMHGEPVLVDSDATVRDVIDTMADQEVGSVIVTEVGQMAGIITERDIVQTVSEHTDLKRTTAADIMSESPYWADPADTISFTIERMVQYGIQHMPVVRTGRPVGIVSARDILRAMSEHERWAVTNGAG